MDLSNLQPAEGATKQRKRIGRGQGSGRGGTSTRGHKGAKSRSGYSRKIGFEGGQMPLQKRVPKFGFTNNNRVEFKGVNLDTLQFLADTKKVKEITREVLLAIGIISRNDLVKILGRGELKAKLDVTVEQFSASAKEAIEKTGGKATATYVSKKAKLKAQAEVVTPVKAAPKKEAKATEAAKPKEAKAETKPKEDTSKKDESTEGKED